MRGQLRLKGLAIPGSAWFLVFLLCPMLLVVITACLERGTYGGIKLSLTGENISRVFDPIYLNVLWMSTKLAGLTAAICFLLGFPMALAMSAASQRLRTIFVFAIAVPFLTNLIIRIYALKMLVGYDGPVMTILSFFGLGNNPFALSQNVELVFYGMVTTYLPFMVFPLYSALEKFDFALVEAAQDLGAGNRQILWRVVLPNIIPAVRSGITLVFIPALGEFVIPDLLGGARSMLIGNLITEQFLKARDWPFGAALSLVLLSLLAIVLLLLNFLGREAPPEAS